MRNGLLDQSAIELFGRKHKLLEQVHPHFTNLYVWDTTELYTAESRAQHLEAND